MFGLHILIRCLFSFVYIYIYEGVLETIFIIQLRFIVVNNYCFIFLYYFIFKNKGFTK